MKDIMMSSLLLFKKITTNRSTSSMFIVALWLCGMLAASIPLISLSSLLALIWPRVCLAWHKANRTTQHQLPMNRKVLDTPQTEQ